MRNLFSEFRYALRSLRSHPAFTITAVLTLALGIGVTTAMFGVVDGIVLRPLPFPHADRLVTICEQYPGATADWCSASPPNVEDIGARDRDIEAIGLARNWGYRMRTAAGSEGVAAGIATPGLFTALGAKTKLGRLFTRADLLGRESDVAVLTEEMWRKRFASDPGVVGRSIVLDGQPVTIIGVLDSGFAAPRLSYVKLWRPLNISPTDEKNRDWHGFIAYGRLRPGVSIEAARAGLAGVAAQLRREHFLQTAGWDLNLMPLENLVIGNIRPVLLVFFGAVFLILLIACANVANLLLARASARGREIALRSALGAGRGRIVGALLVESFVLAIAGAIVGIGIAAWGTSAFQTFAPDSVPRISDVRVDVRVLTFALLLAVFTTVVFGLLPAVRAARFDLAQALREGSRSASTRGSRFGAALVTSELALALMLVAGAGLLTRSFAALTRWQPGFEREHVLTFSLSSPQERYNDRAAIVGLWSRVERELRAIPGVTAVGSTSAGPLFGGGDGAAEIRIAGATTPTGATAEWFNVSPGYFGALGVPVVRGRALDDRDAGEAPPTALVNETFARRYFPTTNPVGRRVSLVRSDHAVEIAGVVRDIPPMEPGKATPAELYFSSLQEPRGFIYFVVRTAVAPASIMASVRSRLSSVDADLTPANVSTMPELVADRLTAPRFDMLVLLCFACAALVLAAIGTYGLFAYVISRRTRELGIRLALGAAPAQIVNGVLRDGLTLAVGGAAIGTVGTLLAARALGSLVAQVSVVDPLTIAASAVTLLIVAALACFVPARRAGRVDPIVTLSAE